MTERTYTIGSRLNGEPGRFEIREENQRAVSVYDRDGDFIADVLPNASPYDGGSMFRTVFGETFRVLPALGDGNTRYLIAVGVDRLVGASTV